MKNKESRINEIASQYEEILDSMSEEDKSSDAINEDGSAFVNAQVSKLAKQYSSEMKKGAIFDSDSFESKIIKCADLIAEEKQLKKLVKDETDSLHVKTKETIENLDDIQVKELLRIKWISKLVLSLKSMPGDVVDALVANINDMAKKYSETFEDVEKNIAVTEKELCSLIDDLRGNDFDMKGLSELKSLLMGE